MEIFDNVSKFQVNAFVQVKNLEVHNEIWVVRLFIKSKAKFHLVFIYKIHIDNVSLNNSIVNMSKFEKEMKDQALLLQCKIFLGQF